jgi:hypothetical protein
MGREKKPSTIREALICHLTPRTRPLPIYLIHPGPHQCLAGSSLRRPSRGSQKVPAGVRQAPRLTRVDWTGGQVTTSGSNLRLSAYDDQCGTDYLAERGIATPPGVPGIPGAPFQRRAHGTPPGHWPAPSPTDAPDSQSEGCPIPYPQDELKTPQRGSQGPLRPRPFTRLPGGQGP